MKYCGIPRRVIFALRVPGAFSARIQPEQEHLVIHRPTGYRLAHGTADVLSALLLVIAYVDERYCLYTEVRREEMRRMWFDGGGGWHSLPVP